MLKQAKKSRRAAKSNSLFSLVQQVLQRNRKYVFIQNPWCLLCSIATILVPGLACTKLQKCLRVET